MKPSNVIGKQPKSNFNWWRTVIVGETVIRSYLATASEEGGGLGPRYFVSTFNLRPPSSSAGSLSLVSLQGSQKPRKQDKKNFDPLSPFRQKQTSRAAPANQTDFHVLDRWLNPLNQFSPAPSKLKWKHIYASVSVCLCMCVYSI